MVDIEAYIEALKTTWVRREIRSNHSWTALFKYIVDDNSCIWERNTQSVMEMSKQIVNTFWSEVLGAFSTLIRGIHLDLDKLSRYGL